MGGCETQDSLPYSIYSRNIYGGPVFYLGASDTSLNKTGEYLCCHRIHILREEQEEKKNKHNQLIEHIVY